MCVCVCVQPARRVRNLTPNELAYSCKFIPYCIDTARPGRATAAIAAPRGAAYITVVGGGARPHTFKLYRYTRQKNVVEWTRPPPAHRQAGRPIRRRTCARCTRRTSRPTPLRAQSDELRVCGIRETEREGGGDEGRVARRGFYRGEEGTHRSIHSDCPCPCPPPDLARGLLFSVGFSLPPCEVSACSAGVCRWFILNLDHFRKKKKPCAAHGASAASDAGSTAGSRARAGPGAAALPGR